MLHAMRRLRKWQVLGIVAVLFGAGALWAGDYWFDDQVMAERFWRRLETEDDWERRRQILLYLANPPNEGENVARLFSGWGLHGELYDQAVNEMIHLYTHPSRAYRCVFSWKYFANSLFSDPLDLLSNFGVKREDVDLTLTAETARALQDVVARDESLLRAVFMSDRNRLTAYRGGTYASFHFHEEHWLPVMHQSLLSFSLSRTGKFTRLLELSGWFQRPDIFLDCRWETVDDDWKRVLAWLDQVGPYSYCDETLDHFVVDEAAMEKGIPVDPERQRWAYPETNKYLQW
jgi:hypothetical protein